MTLDRTDLIDQVRKLTAAPSVYEGLKKKAQRFLDVAGTPEEQPAFADLVKELKADILTIDALIAFADSPDGVAVFGEKESGGIAAAAKQAKEQGETVCICPACQTGKIILENQTAIAL